MSDIHQLVTLLEEKTMAAQKKYQAIIAQNKSLSQTVEKLQLENQQFQEELIALKEQNQTLKIANRILGSKEHPKEVKLKINTLIREIDACIVQLSK